MRESSSHGKGKSQKKDRKGNQPVTSPDQPTVRIAMVRQQYPEKGFSPPDPSVVPTLSTPPGRDERMSALAPRPPGALPCSALVAPLTKQSLNVSNASFVKLFPTLR